MNDSKPISATKLPSKRKAKQYAFPNAANRGTDTFRRVQRVSKRAALASKKKIWDSNSASIDAALSAVDQWESLYSSFKRILESAASSALKLYCTAKSGAARIEHHLMVPVRDFIIMPSFWGVERSVTLTAEFISSDQASNLARQTIALIGRAPFGEQVICPIILASFTFAHNVWAIIQYPIPSRKRVADVTDGALNATKRALSTLGYSIHMYVKIFDATITRKLMHTQWRVLRSGPYATLDEQSKQEVINHICERYFSIKDSLARYELVAHIKSNNMPLFVELVTSGLLFERGRSIGSTAGVTYDVWLSKLPIYRRRGLLPWHDLQTSEMEKQGNNTKSHHIFLMNEKRIDEENILEGLQVVPLWFYLPCRDGKRPQGGVPWVPFSEQDRYKLEEEYIRQMDHNYGLLWQKENDNTVFSSPEENQGPLCHSIYDQVLHSLHLRGGEIKATKNYELKESITLPSDNIHEECSHSCSGSVASKAIACVMTDNFLRTAASRDSVDQNQLVANRSLYDAVERILGFQFPLYAQSTEVTSNDNEVRFSTKSKMKTKWYEPALGSDVLVDQKRYAVSLVRSVKVTDELDRLVVPTIRMLKRPILWRFHGEGDEVRRATWFLDTKSGLQPYCESSAALLEDAYQFLKWFLAMNPRRMRSSVLLTIQVTAPDGVEQQLIQFTSLNKVAAVQKSLGGALSLRKSRVFRGACFLRPPRAKQAKPTSTLSISLPVIPHHPLSARISYASFGKSLVVNNNSHKNITSVSCIDMQQEVENLVLVIHGIGEMMRTVDLFGLGLPALSPITTCCDCLRSNHSEVWRCSETSSLESDSSKLGRVEYIPIEWHEAFAIQSRRSGSDFDTTGEIVREVAMPSLEDVSLKTIPHLRGFANDTLLDVLYFLAPEYHDAIIKIVTSEMEKVVRKFCDLHGSNFKGQISVLGHSLGSVIAWDILAHQTPINIMPPGYNFSHPDVKIEQTFGYTPLRRIGYSNAAYPQLSFRVENAFMIGSPLAVFLIIRNQHMPMSLEYKLPGCENIFNIFHPYDPAAYRLEPLICPAFASVEPEIINHWRGGFRVHYQTKMLWKKCVDRAAKIQRSFGERVERVIESTGILDFSSEDEVHKQDIDSIEGSLGSDEDSDNWSNDSKNYQLPCTPLCGKLNQGRRIDYMLQEKEIEISNEYVFAIGAHSAYWDEKDLSMFIAKELAKYQGQTNM